jgi:glutamate synthase domain-containing protein 1/glutamate synthase domain-containing protein 3
VLGLAANVPVSGRHVLTASYQMHNRGNGKGGGIAMAGLVPEQAGVDAGTLRSHYLLQVALLDPSARAEVEAQYIEPHFQVAAAAELPHLPDHRAIRGLEIRPPDVWRYFVRVRPEALDRFAESEGMLDLPLREVEDEFVYQNSYRLNHQFYASLGEKRAFVLCHGRDLSVLKIVGYAEQLVEYYRLEDLGAHVWIAHQRYPTKGRVWHPGGAHPFIGLKEALVHNGDFANYHAVSEYLRQRGIGQLFLTDTEVSVQLFDLWERVYGYPLEITLEAMAPTTEHDFAMLPTEKQSLYQAVQRTHMHGSPDGPWFFILARSLIDTGQPAEEDRYELLGITDTSMLRPQVFALYENLNPMVTCSDCTPVQIGLIASERQAINACLRSLSEADRRFQPLADKYWVARGGSHTDGGAFRFSFSRLNGLEVMDKFGKPLQLEEERLHVDRAALEPGRVAGGFRDRFIGQAQVACERADLDGLWPWLIEELAGMSWDEVAWALEWLVEFASKEQRAWEFSLEILHRLRDRRYDPGRKKRASLQGLLDGGIQNILGSVPLLDESGLPANPARRLTWENRQNLRAPGTIEDPAPTLAIDSLGFPPEGDDCAARWMARAVALGWKRLLVYNWRGGRFAASGLGPDTAGVRVDLYGDAGDYCASGLDGAEVVLHADGQDQLGQVMRRGRLVIHGDVGQTFLYGAKGGEIFVLGSAAGRPLINAVGRPRVVINGTCLDYLAESFMAGDPLQGGGFIILNGITFDENGALKELDSPYPGGNLFSLASGGAIYLRDPHGKVGAGQLNGGEFAELTGSDWELIRVYLEENERLFGIRVADLLTVEGGERSPVQVYRKIAVRGSSGKGRPEPLEEFLEGDWNR